MAALALATCSVVWGQDVGLPELRRMYDDVVAQLKQAQERKLELATENERLLAERDSLTARVAALEAEVEQLKGRVAAAESSRLAGEQEAARLAGRSWEMRSILAAWEAFLSSDTALRRRWDAYVQSDTAGPMWWLDRDWPLRRE